MIFFEQGVYELVLLYKNSVGKSRIGAASVIQILFCQIIIKQWDDSYPSVDSHSYLRVIRIENKDHIRTCLWISGKSSV